MKFLMAFAIIVLTAAVMTLFVKVVIGFWINVIGAFLGEFLDR